MGIGASIFLLAVGAILAFAVQDTMVAGIDISIIGFILIGAGILGLILFLMVFGPRNRRGNVVEERVIREDPVDPRY